jgi:hypothetical protein
MASPLPRTACQYTTFHLPAGLLKGIFIFRIEEQCLMTDVITALLDRLEAPGEEIAAVTAI